MREQVLTGAIPIGIATMAFVIFAYLATLRRERFLLYWTAGWGFHTLRFLGYVLWGVRPPVVVLDVLDFYLRLAFAGCILAGVLELRRRRVKPLNVAAIGAVLLLAAYAARWVAPVLQIGTMIQVIIAAVAIVGAWQFAAVTTLPVLERRTTAVALAAYGLAAVLSYQATSQRAAVVLLYASLAAQLMVAIGMLATFFRASYESELLTERHMGISLTQALGGFVPICMHCKSIRDDQEQWQPIESYITERSSTTFSHGLCPACASKYYALDAPPEP